MKISEIARKTAENRKPVTHTDNYRFSKLRPIFIGTLPVTRQLLISDDRVQAINLKHCYLSVPH